ncbi:MAG TPA: cyclic nucleotide-binding domain-containing protein [Candidatus Cloacimonadota bacterium]|nr:cyclic nucleotide-binding domain-containing protein [Candidatus Cloacimonadota bacterium]
MIDTGLLKKVRILEGMNDAQLLLLQTMLKPQNFKSGEYILKDESFGDMLYILVEGRVRVTKELVKGIDIGRADEKVLASLDGELLPTFGENGILGHAPRTANVIAQTDCLLYFITKTDFEELASRDVAAAYLMILNIARVLSDRLHTTDDNLVKLATALFIAAQQ